MKPLMAVLRQKGQESTDYTDDTWVVCKTKMEVDQNIVDTRVIPTNLDIYYKWWKACF